MFRRSARDLHHRVSTDRHICTAGDAAGAGSGVVFENRTVHAGITFQLENHPTPGKYLIESITGGCAFLDYDGDGLLDIYLMNGAAIRPSGVTPTLDQSDPRYWNRLYRNLGGGRFRDVTDAARVQGRGYGLGVATGDYDNDGYPDLYVTNYGGNELFHNQGDGTFREVSGSAGVRGGGFSTSAVFVDYDRDGLLDLYVARYGNWSFTNNIFCGVAGVRDYCHPRHFNGEPDLLFRNISGDIEVRDGIVGIAEFLQGLGNGCGQRNSELSRQAEAGARVVAAPGGVCCTQSACR